MYIEESRVKSSLLDIGLESQSRCLIGVCVITIQAAWDRVRKSLIFKAISKYKAEARHHIKSVSN